MFANAPIAIFSAVGYKTTQQKYNGKRSPVYVCRLQVFTKIMLGELIYFFLELVQL